MSAAVESVKHFRAFLSREGSSRGQTFDFFSSPGTENDLSELKTHLNNNPGLSVVFIGTIDG